MMLSNPRPTENVLMVHLRGRASSSLTSKVRCDQHASRSAIENSMENSMENCQAGNR
jgi:hypothetical protein